MSENNHETVKAAPGSSPWSRFWSRFAAEPEPSVAHHLYERLVRHARFPLYYERLGIADTPEGRFEVLALHVGMTVRRLFALDEEGRTLGQALFDLMTSDLDDNLRELGVGDLSVGKQMKRLASQFYARLAVLNEAFDEGRLDALRPMIETNLLGRAGPAPETVSHLVAITVALEEALARQSAADLKAGRLTLPEESALAALGERC